LLHVCCKLKFENIDISNSVPLAFSILVITIKPQSTHVVNGLSQRKSEVISHSNGKYGDPGIQNSPKKMMEPDEFWIYEERAQGTEFKSELYNKRIEERY